MVYLSLGDNTIKLLSLKKSVMGQFETFYFEKTHQIKLLESGQIVNTDLIASAVKEALNSSKSVIREKDVCLILPQESFSYLRITIPSDIAESAINSFIKDKAMAEWQANLDDYFFDYLVLSANNKSVVNLFALHKDNFTKYQEALSLINQHIVNVIPETLAYFKLFEKTLRKEKPENIFYVVMTDNQMTGYLYDSGGLTSDKSWKASYSKDVTAQSVLKEFIDQKAKSGQKLSRLILSGIESGHVRQDTFTKEIGLWTNPLKRIISGFYQEYLKQLITADKQPFPILKYDLCFGAFIFSLENKQFTLVRRSSGLSSLTRPKFSFPQLKLPLKEIFIFILSFVLSFILFIYVSRSGFNSAFLNQLTKFRPLTKTVKPTTAPTQTPTPTPAYKKEEIKIKILNGSGTAGLASTLKDALIDKGYGEILTGNADNFDYLKSIIKVKKNRRQAADWIEKDLKDTLPRSVSVETLADDQTADVVIIIGQDFK